MSEVVTVSDDVGESESPPAVVRKCCPNGKNLSALINGKRECQLSTLTFQPLFYDSNDTHMWSYDSNLFETIVEGNPLPLRQVHKRMYKLEPEKNSEDEYYLMVNGSLFMPFVSPPILTTKEFCMEMFWSPENPAGLTVPMVCFPAPEDSSSVTLIVYAVGLIISVPFLLATICVYTFIVELRTTYGKCLACHCACLATAFSCLAATQLGGDAFPQPICTLMGTKPYVCFSMSHSVFVCLVFLVAQRDVRRHVVDCEVSTYRLELKLIFTTDRAKMRRQFVWYCLYAFLLPLILLTITLAMEFTPAVPSTYLKPNFGVVACWFKTDKAALPFFYGPVALSLLMNLFLFVLTSRSINRLGNDPESSGVPMIASNATHNSVQPSSSSFAVFPQSNSAMGNISERLKRHRKKFRMSLYLCTLMSVSWIMEVVSWAAGADSGPSVWSVFDMLNALQGLFIFVIYVLQKSVRTRVKIKWCKRSMPENTVLLHVASEPSVFENGRRDDV
ncbi:G-protein coupled receptor Mth2 [Eumeta japonica]|uniref:G-protein coupled receptor Mth2 n=1 Tax=Eumeta variegata TaxID=151549 RepID=A0A4C1XFS8_EUMVA|nr:G-protein coupled receptor Mth2 [Eumeta japonica]